MKRRKFVGTLGLGVLGLPVVTEADGRLYGTPNSLKISIAPATENKIKLGLSRADVPVSIWNQMTAFSSMATTILSNSQARLAFAGDTDGYLESCGIPKDLLNSNDHEMRLLKFCSEPEVRSLAQSGNYAAFFSKLQAESLVSGRGNLRSGLVRLYANALQSNAKSAQALLDRLSGTGAPSDTLTVSNVFEAAIQPLLATADHRKESPSPNPDTSVIVDVDTILVFHVFFATEISVFVWAVAIAALVVVGVDPLEQGAALDLSSAKNKLASSLINPALVDEIALVGRAARIAGNFDFASRAYKDVIDFEMDAVLEAAETIGFVNLTSEKRATTLELLKQSAYRSLNV